MQESRQGASAIFTPRPAGSESESVIRLSPQTAAALGMRGRETVRVKLHKVVLPLSVELHAEPDRTIVQLPRRAFRLLRLPAFTPLQLRRTADGSLDVGPFIGILTPLRRARNPYQEQTTFFRRLLRYARHQHIGLYVFSPDEIDWSTRTIRGWNYRPGKGWFQRRYPLPHAVYDRSLLTRKVRRAQRRFERLGTPLFNSLMGSKWWQYRVLRDNAQTREYLPETRKVRSGRDLGYMLGKYRSVYIKAAHGGKGMGIWQVSRTREGRYLLRQTNRYCRVRTATTGSIAPLAHAILHSRRQPYIVQARLWLLRWQGRIFDIRVLVQKDGTGKWQVTGAGLRVGRRGGIVSNLHGGGKTAPLEPVLEQLLTHRSPQSVKDECYRLGLKIASLIDHSCRNIGELGIDLALDRFERLWFLEANSRTGRNVFRRLGSPELAQSADTRPIDYAVRLAGF